MYCFCRCFLYPKTECIMWYGAVRRLYLFRSCYPTNAVASAHNGNLVGKKRPLPCSLWHTRTNNQRCTRTKSQRRSNYRFRQNFTFLKRKRIRYPRWRRNLLYVFDWVWKLSIVKFPQSPILLLNKSVFPIAMYCFCRFLYPRTECIMWYGLCGDLTLSLSLWPLEWTKGCKRSDRKESRCLSYSPATNIMWMHITPLQRMISFDIRLQGTQTIEK